MNWKMFMVALLATGCTSEPEATRLEDLDLAKLEGLPTRCAEAAARSAYDTLPRGSVSDMAKVLSVSGAAETIGAAVNAIEVEIERCVIDVYLMGIEDGRVLEREVY